MRGTRGKGKFTLAQREACYSIMQREDVNQYSGAEILSKVGYGELPPFKISPASVSRISRELRATRTVDGIDLSKSEPLTAVDELIRDAIRLAQRALARLEMREARGELEPDDLRRWTACLRDLRVQAMKVQPKGNKPHSEAENAPETEDSETAWLGADDGDHTGDNVSQSTVAETDTAETQVRGTHIERDEASEADSARGEPIPIEHADRMAGSHA